MLRRLVLTAVLTGSLVVTPAAFVFAQNNPMQDSLQIKVTELEQQIRSLTDQVERRDFELRKLRSEMDVLQKNVVSLQTQSTPETTQLQQTTQTEQQSQLTAPTIPADAPPADDGAAYIPPKNSSEPELGQVVEQNNDNQPTGITSKMSAAKAYDDAYAAFQSGQYAKAEQDFATFLKTYPDHALAGNAQYWQGEAQFAQNNFDGAARTFARNFQTYPKGSKAPESLLKLSAALDKSGKTSDACLTLREMKSRFPDASPSLHARAAEDSRRMGCPETANVR